jgi:hypothetical protein
LFNECLYLKKLLLLKKNPENESPEPLKRDTNGNLKNGDKLSPNEFKIVLITDLYGIQKRRITFDNEGVIFNLRQFSNKRKSFSPKNFNKVLKKLKMLPLKFLGRKIT